MPSFGKFDDRSFKEFADNFDSQVKAIQAANIVQEGLKKSGIVALNGVKKKTPTKTGTLRRAWHLTPVKLSGKTATITLANSMEYAPYVEYGHRQKVGQYVPAIGKQLKQPYVKGEYMLENTLAEADDRLQKIANETMQQLLKNFGG